MPRMHPFDILFGFDTKHECDRQMVRQYEANRALYYNHNHNDNCTKQLTT